MIFDPFADDRRRHEQERARRDRVLDEPRDDRTGAVCDARIRPFPDTTVVACEERGEHAKHAGVVRDYSFKGSETMISWFESDRRTFHGEWPGQCAASRLCPLPLGHGGRCVV